MVDRDLNSAVNIAKRAGRKFKAEWSSHFDNLKTKLRDYQEMYMNNSSCLCMTISKVVL